MSAYGHVCRAAAAAYSVAAAMTAVAQDGSSLGGLGLREGELDFPGVGQVVVAFALAVALAIAAVWALRRFWPLPAAQRSGTPIRVSAQLALGHSLKLHFVEHEGATLVVAEGRAGVAIAQLAKAPHAAEPESNDR